MISMLSTKRSRSFSRGADGSPPRYPCLLWWDEGGTRLTAEVRSTIADPASKVFVSAASVWEIAIKRRIGKLRFDRPVVAAIAANHFSELPIGASDAERAGALQWDHRDPFDRMLVAQSLEHTLTLVTCDPAMRAVDGISILWAAG